MGCWTEVNNTHGTEAPLADIHTTRNSKLFGGQQAVELAAFVACPIGWCRSAHWLNNESDLRIAVVFATAVPFCTQGNNVCILGVASRWDYVRRVYARAKKRTSKRPLLQRLLCVWFVCALLLSCVMGQNASEHAVTKAVAVAVK